MSGPAAILNRLVQEETRLQPRHKFVSLMFLVIMLQSSTHTHFSSTFRAQVVVPYLKGKLDALHKRLAVPTSPFGGIPIDTLSEEQLLAQAVCENLC